MAAKKTKGENRAKAGPISKERLKSFVERIEKMLEEKAAISQDLADIYAEAHGVGYDKKTIRRVVKERAKDAGKRAEEETLFDVYAHALGLQMDLFPSNSRTTEERV